MATTKIELLPCPFCGDTASLCYTNDNHRSPYVQCDGAIQTNGTPSCYAMIQPWRYKTEQEAIEAWNRRVNRSEKNARDKV